MPAVPVAILEENNFATQWFENRLNEVTTEIEDLYKEIGNKLKKDFKGYNAWIISSSPEAIKSIGLRPSRRIQIYNGSLECRYLKFELYDGSKKASKNPDTMTRR